MSNFDDVVAFQKKFDIPMRETPGLLDTVDTAYRAAFMFEELNEFRKAVYEEQNLAKAADALVDLVYVTMGTAALMGLPWQALWNEVQAANMRKMKAADAHESLKLTGRGHKHDVIKPPGWVPPNIDAVLFRHQAFETLGDPEE